MFLCRCAEPPFTPPEQTVSEKYKLVRIYGDGQCFFRCTATFMSVELELCTRDEFGLPTCRNMRKTETSTAQRLRNNVVQCLKDNLHELQALQSGLPFLLERKIGEHYSSLSDRIEHMNNTSEYVGELEILAMASIMNMQIFIHQHMSRDTFPLMAKIPLECCGWRKMHLCYTMDTAVTDGHFDLLIDENRDTPLTVNSAIQGQSRNDSMTFIDLVRLSLCGSQSSADNSESTLPGDGLISIGLSESTLPVDIPKPNSVSTLPDESLMPNSTSTLPGEGGGSMSNQESTSPVEELTPNSTPTLTGDGSISNSQHTTKHTSVLKNVISQKQSTTQELYKGLKLSDADKYPWLQNTGKDKHGKRCVKCTICADALSTCKLLSKSHRIPPIAEGCRYNAKTIIDHALSSIHRASVEGKANSKLFEKGSTDHPWIAVCVKMNRSLYEKCVVTAFDVFNDAKIGTLSAWSWPSRHLARLASSAFIAGDRDTCVVPFSPSVADIQYLNPEMHSEIAHCIADIGREDLAKGLRNALAVSLSYDGSVDAYQEDSKYVGVRYVTVDGEVKAAFLGSEEPTERGVAGAIGALKNVLDNSTWTFEEAVKVISGFTTDGESLNTGSKNGLWTKIREQCSLQVICFWCACHRSSLAFKNLFKEVDEANKVLQDCRNLATFFRASGLRSIELSRIADSMAIKILHFPEYKEVRMTEFTSNLIQSVIRNLPACLKYWTDTAENARESNTDRNQMRGFLRIWTQIDHLKLLHVLLDCCGIVQRLQKRLQYTFAVLDDVVAVKNWAVVSLNAMNESPCVGGYEQNFLSSLDVGEDTTTWHGFQLSLTERRRTERAHLYTSVITGRSYAAVRQEVITSLVNFINDRLDGSDLTNLASVLFNPRSWLNTTNDNDFVPTFGRAELLEYHTKYVPDLDLTSLVSDFTLLKSLIKSDKAAMSNLCAAMASEVDNDESAVATKQPSTLSLLKYAAQNNVPTFTTACARVACVFPHSMYVERLVSSHNLIKSDIRSSMKRSTINDYLIIKESMGPVSKFDPRPAVAKWLQSRDRRPKTSETEAKIEKYKNRDFVKKFFH